MQGVFRLRGVDIHRVLAVRPFGETDWAVVVRGPACTGLLRVGLLGRLELESPVPKALGTVLLHRGDGSR
jgi:hypothetical protein